MKFLILITMVFSVTVLAQVNYEPNDGNTPPGTFTSKSSANASPTSSDSGMINSSGVTTDAMNSSPNPAPESDAELIDESILTHGTKSHIEREAQEENALDYSTTPEKWPKLKKNR